MRAPRAGSLFVIAAATLLGCATSILIAWRDADLKGDTRSTITSTDAAGHRWGGVVWNGPTRDACNVRLQRNPVATVEPQLPADLRLPNATWREMIRASIHHAPRSGFWNLQAFGWPRQCMAGGFLNPQTGKGSINLGWYDQTHTKLLNSRIPLRPIWSGLLINTALFATPWALLLVLPFPLRRALRRRRGRCIRCAYDLRGDFTRGCPECGWKRPPLAPSHTAP